MRGLAFPTTAVYEREESCDYGTPFSGGDIPFDPALPTPVDPALMEEGQCTVVAQPHPSSIVLQHPPIRHPRQYSQGPQGDPFAPQPQPTYFPMDQSPVPTSAKPPKKRRKFVREMECGFCQGGDDRNQHGVPEKLLTCSECGRSGHPSCLDLGQLGDVIRLYAWKCVDCKSCEVCKEKGHDTHMLFCDVCDRGWHMECLQPPLSEEPPGQWNCPRCPLPSPQQVVEEEQPQEPEPPIEQTPRPPSPEIPIDPALREASVASSSRSVPRASDPKKARKGKAKAATPVDSEPEVAEHKVGRSPSTPKRPSKSRSRWKGKAPMKELREVIEEADETADVEVEEAESSRPFKRMRLRLSSPVPPPSSPPKTTPVIRLRLPPRGKGKEREDEPEDVKKGMFDELLSQEDRDVSHTTIKDFDKQRFERSRISGDLKLFPAPVSATTPDVPETPVTGSSSRPLRSTAQHVLPSGDPTPGPSTSPAPSSSTPDPKASATGLRIRTIRFGDFDIQTWYDAPFPEEYANIPDGRLWLCEFCLKYMKSQFVARRHQTKCKMRHPPGDEIYRDGTISIFEVDGRKNKIYCQNLCLLSKMFLDHKSLFYDVEPFLFYVMTEVDDGGARFVGYFSKEKRSPKDYNVSCIMTLPVRQRQGWGNLLIDFSYLLSKKEQRQGSPEKPLSALGALGYRNYWTLALMRYLQTAPDSPTLDGKFILYYICAATSMTVEDLYTTLQQQGMISARDAPSQSRPLPGQSIKFPKGRKNSIARKHLQRTTTQDEEKLKGPFVPPKSYIIRWNPETVDQYMARWEAKGYLKLKPENLKWSPFLVARSRKSDTLQAEVELESPADGDEAESPRSRSRTGNSSMPDENGVGTPKPGSSSRALKAIRATDSPAAALFDDDVEVLPSNRHELPTIPATSSPEPASRPASPEERRSLRKQLPQGATPLRRSSRQSTVTPSQISPSQTPSSKQNQRQPVIGMRRNRSGGIRGVASGGNPPPTPSSLAAPNGKVNVPEPPIDPLVANDAALAAKLALEEVGLPRRQLRSRSNTEQDGTLFTLPLPPLRRMSSSFSTGKKRKMVESPDGVLEGKGEDGGDIVPPTPTPQGRNVRVPRRSSFQVDKSDGMDFAVLPPVEQKESSEMTNGLVRGKSKGKGRGKAKGSGGGRGKVQKGRGQGSSTEESPLDYRATALNGFETGQEERDEAVNDADGPASLIPEPREGSCAPQHVDRVKFEDAETPMMGVTPGRQSAPSDSTLCVLEDLSMGIVKGSPDDGGLHDVEMQGPMVVNEAEEREEEERVARAEEEEEGEDEGLLPRVIPEIADLGMRCEEGDADAEGEIDEGVELDAEGELDIDAEGEIDEDVDAEGELDAEGEDDVDIDAEGEIDFEESI